MAMLNNQRVYVFFLFFWGVDDLKEGQRAYKDMTWMGKWNAPLEVPNGAVWILRTLNTA